MTTVINITPYAEAKDKQFATYKDICKKKGITESNPKSLKEFFKEYKK